jgi:predicted permease
LESAPALTLTQTKEFSWLAAAQSREIWIKILIKISWNPVLWAIAIGFIFSLSKFGPTYLKPLAGPEKPNPDFYEPLAWVWWTTEWLGSCVTPVSLFLMGVWMQSQGKNLFQLTISESVIYMYCKLVLVPLLALGLAKAVDLSNEAGRAAVLIAALPISQAGFSLGSQYQIGERVLAGNVALGTILLLPTILLWNLILDETDCFPLEPSN